MPDLSQLWQRFLVASALLIGLLVGIVATVFGYSNLTTVDVKWSIFQIDAVPLWTVAVVPLTVVLIAGSLYHWSNSLHHFTEHMRHRRRVHELEAEVATLRSHLDHALEMPDQAPSSLPGKPITTAGAALPEPESGDAKPRRRAGTRRSASDAGADQPSTAAVDAVAANGVSPQELVAAENTAGKG